MSEHVIHLDMFQGVRVLPPTVPQKPSSISILENEAFYEIRSFLPDVAEDVIVGIADNVLTIGAKACAEAQRSIGRFFSIDHRVALIEQSISLPPDASTRDLTTTFRDGLLSVFLTRRSVSNVVPLLRR